MNAELSQDTGGRTRNSKLRFFSDLVGGEKSKRLSGHILFNIGVSGGPTTEPPYFALRATKGQSYVALAE